MDITILAISALATVALARCVLQGAERASTCTPAWLPCHSGMRSLRALAQLLDVAQKPWNPEALADAVWEVAQAANATCAVWTSLDHTQRAGLVHSRSDGSVSEHALSALADWAVACVSEGSAKLLATTDVRSRRRGPREERLAEAGLQIIRVAPITAQGEIAGALTFAGRAANDLGAPGARLLHCAAAVLGQAAHRARLEMALAQTRDLLTRISDGGPLFVMITDPRGRVTMVNQPCADAMGLAQDKILGRLWTKALGKSATDSNLERLAEEVLATGAPTSFRTRLGRLAARERVVQWTLQRHSDSANLKAGLLLIGTDVTEQAHMEGQWMRIGKLALAGESLARAAHELNNPLAAILGFAELAESQHCAACSQAARLTHVAAQARRCKRIVTHLLSLLRPSRSQREPISLNDLVAETVELMAYQLSLAGVHVVTHLAVSLPPVFADAHELQQVLVNLLTNALQAVAEVGGGTVELATRTSGDWVEITVADDGPGVPPEAQAAIFEPFFTTKPQGMGTGLGLSISRSITEDHGGTLTVTNRPTGGAVFTLQLPALRTPQAVTRKWPAEAADPPSPAPAHGTVLVVDDEEPLRLLMVEALEQEGFAAQASDDAHEALAILSQRPFDAVICDLKMPGMSGQDFYEDLCALQPDMAHRVIIATGDTGSEEAREFLLRTGCKFIEKPFTIHQLTALVRQCMVAPRVGLVPRAGT